VLAIFRASRLFRRMTSSGSFTSTGTCTEEHRRAHQRGRARRRLGIRLQRIGRKFEQALAEAPVSERDRQRWRKRRRLGVAAPASPADVRPLLFRGRAESGSELRLVSAAGGTLQAFVDGAAVAVLDDAEELTKTEPGLVFVLDGGEFLETFTVPRSVLARLRDAVEAGRVPQQENIRGLLEDGLLDGTLSLTARGRRALALDRRPARHEEQAPSPAISIRGPVPSRARAELVRALAHVARVAPRPILHVAASLVREEDPALPRPVVAKATIDLGGRIVRAHAAAATESEAIGLLESRLLRNLRRLAERAATERREGQPPEPGEWRHRNIAPAAAALTGDRSEGERVLT